MPSFLIRNGQIQVHYYVKDMFLLIDTVHIHGVLCQSYTLGLLTFRINLARNVKSR